MKKAVFILQEATRDGIEGYIVKGWENVLRDDELPEEYFDRVPNFYAMDTKIILNYPYNIMSQLNEIYNRQQTQIIKDDFLSERDWKISLEFMLQAGHRLSKILEEQRKPKVIRFEI